MHEPRAAADTSEKRLVVGTAIVLVIITGGSRVLGLVREAVIAAVFGAGARTDSFFVAFSIPDFLFNSLSSFLIATSFIPIFCKCMGGKGLWEFTSAVFISLVAALAAIVVVLEVFAAEIVSVIMPSAGPEQMALTVDMTRIMLPIIIAGALTGMAKGILNSFRKFTVPAVTTVAYNVVIIGAVVIFGSSFGIRTLAIGVLAAAAAQFLIQVPSLRKIGAKFVPNMDFRNGEFLSFLENIWPVILALSIGQLITYFEFFLASRISEGSISFLNFANRIFVLPEQVVVAAITTVMFPLLSVDAAEKRNDRIAERLSKGIRMTLFMMLPVSIFMAGFSVPIIGTLLGRGEFSQLAIEGTGAALASYSLGLISISIRALLLAVFFAMRDTRTLLLVTASMVPFNMIIDLELIRHFSYRGIALGTAVTATFHAAILVAILRKRIGSLDWGPPGTFLKIFLSAGVMAGLSCLIAGAVPAVTSFPGNVINLSVLMGTGFAAYYVFNLLLRVEEAKWVREFIREKWLRKISGGIA